MFKSLVILTSTISDFTSAYDADECCGVSANWPELLVVHGKVLQYLQMEHVMEHAGYIMFSRYRKRILKIALKATCMQKTRREKKKKKSSNKLHSYL